MSIQRVESRVEEVGGLKLTARNASLSDLAEILRDQHARKVDVVAPAHTIRSEGGVWVIQGTDVQLDEDGVTETAGRYVPTDTADDGISQRLGIPRAYLRRMRQEKVSLYDQNLNGWLEEAGRSFLVRAFKTDEGDGVARAFLSDKFKMIDHLDVLLAALAGIRESGQEIEVVGCDLTDTKMRVKVRAPGIAVYAPDLLAGYRSPFDGRSVSSGWTPERVAAASAREGQNFNGDEPVIFSGFIIENSETGGGAFSLTPRLEIQVCRNGLTIAADALRRVHLGGQMDEGVVNWSADTQKKSLELVTAQARDAVETYLDVEYVRAKVAAMTEAAGKEVEKPAETVKLIVKQLSLPEAAVDDLLAHFVAGGQNNLGGMAQAVSSYAQTVEDADLAADAEAAAVGVLSLAI